MSENERKIPLAEERLLINKHLVEDASVQVSSRTARVPVSAAYDVAHEHVEVDRIPIEQFITAAPEVRNDGDVTIIPVVEERLVVEKRLYLVEEVHVRRTTSFRTERVTAELRKQQVKVERISKGPNAKGDHHG